MKKAYPALSVGRSARLPPGSRDGPEAACRPAAGWLTSSIMVGAGIVEARMATRVRPRLRRPSTLPRCGGSEGKIPSNGVHSWRTNLSVSRRKRQKTLKKVGGVEW